ncbi:DUF2624 family protein [Lysinibacillus telephonicus]|uniref:DUF2624 family protein n=1 Tax=Lysinibacillus telephonicus TaxID=1714840 RepID=A0A431UI65_9BACI|nr:DUF2624 family protein [Lysinibacillus telephonicus]RTQ89445.1 DUF2624 family protein [Lysinibacillus telephonicus]
MKQIEFIEAFLSKSDKEIIQYAKQYDVDLSIDEVRKLRPLVDKASFTWIITGIPKAFLKEVEKIIGKKKLKKLLKLYDSYTQ